MSKKIPTRTFKQWENQMLLWIDQAKKDIKEAQDANENCIGLKRALRELEQDLKEWRS